MIFLIPGVLSIVMPGGHSKNTKTPAPTTRMMEFTWSPQDLTKDVADFLPIPEDDYVKKYQNNPELWPVEFFLVMYRRMSSGTQLLVRKSANGTSKWGVGTGVPARRWMLSGMNPPLGYQSSEPQIEFDARHFPEFPKENVEPSWAYQSIDICGEAFHGTTTSTEKFYDPELEEFANEIRNELVIELSKRINDQKKNHPPNSAWDFSRLSIVKNIVKKPNSIAAIQGTLRMSGLFERRSYREDDYDTSASRRYLDLGDAPDPAKLVGPMRIYTMFPQMPDPMSFPSASPEKLQDEIVSRDALMKRSGRDPHKDVYGRMFTHKSTSNVSNTIIGMYIPLDATKLLDDKGVPPALDLFGTQRVQREWVSLEDLKVLDHSGNISTEDTKPTFISGFIVRQLIKEGSIDIHGTSN